MPQNPRRPRRVEPAMEHLLRRAGFGASQEEIDQYRKKIKKAKMPPEVAEES